MAAQITIRLGTGKDRWARPLAFTVNALSEADELLRKDLWHLLTETDGAIRFSDTRIMLWAALRGGGASAKITLDQVGDLIQEEIQQSESVIDVLKEIQAKILAAVLASGLFKFGKADDPNAAAEGTPAALPSDAGLEKPAATATDRSD